MLSSLYIRQSLSAFVASANWMSIGVYVPQYQQLELNLLPRPPTPQNWPFSVHWSFVVHPEYSVPPNAPRIATSWQNTSALPPMRSFGPFTPFTNSALLLST